MAERNHRYQRSNPIQTENQHNEFIDGIPQLDGELKGPPQACLFVASLGAETTEESIKEVFDREGFPPLKVKLLKEKSTRPYAFVQFKSVEEASDAMEATNGKMVNGRPLRVEKAKVNRTLFIAKMDKSVTAKQLREIAEAFGPVDNVALIKNHQTNKSKGCGFVKFVYREDATNAFVGLKNTQRRWVIEWATSSNDPETLGIDRTNIFVGGLNPVLITKELLQERFGKYGHIESITLINKEPPYPGISPRTAIAASEASKDGVNPEPSTDKKDNNITPNLSDSSDGSEGHAKSAFAFIHYGDSASSAIAIECENGAEWLERRLRVQYCESQEAKNKKRAAKYYSMNYNTPFYPGIPQNSMQPMLMMPSVPMYNVNVPASYRPPKEGFVYPPPYYPPYGTYPIVNPMMPYANQPWVYPPAQGYPAPTEPGVEPTEEEEYSSASETEQGRPFEEVSATYGPMEGAYGYPYPVPYYQQQYAYVPVQRLTATPPIPTTPTDGHTTTQSEEPSSANNQEW